MKQKTKSKVALILLLLVSALLVSPVYVATAASTAAGGWSLVPLSEFNLPEGTVYSIIKNFLGWILAIVGFIALIAFAIAGIMYLTAAGDDERMKTAKNAMTYSIIGVIVALSGLVVVWAADTMLWGTELF